MIADALTVRTSPFHDRAAQACLTNAWTTIEGTTFVAVYRNIEQEYWAMRQAAGIADISYHHALRIAGEEAGAALDHVAATRVGDLAPGSFAQALWCTGSGHVVADGLVLCEDAHSFVIVTRAPCRAFIEDACAGFACAVEKDEAFAAGLHLMGPAAPAILEGAGFYWAPALQASGLVVMTVKGLTVRIVRQDRAGIPSYQLWTAADSASLLWDRLRRAGAGGGLTAVGTAAHRIHRLEAGAPAYGLDYAGALVAPSARLQAFPADLGLGALVDTAKDAFNGRAALLGAPTGPRALVPLAVEGTGPLAPALVMADGAAAGHVTSAGWSPRLGMGLVLAWIDAKILSADKSLALISPPRGAFAGDGPEATGARLCHRLNPA